MVTRVETAIQIDRILTEIEETKETIRHIWKHRNQNITVPIIRYLNRASVRSCRRRLQQLQNDLDYWQLRLD